MCRAYVQGHWTGKRTVVNDNDLVGRVATVVVDVPPWIGVCCIARIRRCSTGALRLARKVELLSYHSQIPEAFGATVISRVMMVTGFPGFMAYVGTASLSGSFAQLGAYFHGLRLGNAGHVAILISDNCESIRLVE